MKLQYHYQYSSYFVTSDNQFGFKKNVGCRDAIYAVKNVIEHLKSPTVQLSMCPRLVKRHKHDLKHGTNMA